MAMERRVLRTPSAADLVDAEATVLVQAFGRDDPRIIGADRLPTTETASRPGSRRSGLGPLLNGTPLELRQA